MGDSAMVVLWPSRDADGNYSSVTLSQRKAPYETMPLLDPDPPFIAMLSLADTSVRASPTDRNCLSFVKFHRRSRRRTPK
jgi:hypothetical protein